MSNSAQEFRKYLEDDPVKGYRLLQLRLMILERKLSREQVAQTVGVSPSYLSRVLHGKVAASLVLLDRIDYAVDALTYAPYEERGTDG